MPEFTSTTLLSLVVGAIEVMDPRLCAGLRRPDPMQTAVTPDTDKTLILSRFVEKHGLSAALRIGQHLDLAEESPVFAVLTRTADPSHLAQKWMRLERYYHSSHRTRIEAPTEQRWMCLRESTAAPASPVENFLISGLLFGLLHRIGVDEPRLEIDGQELSATDFDGAVVDGSCQKFSFHWSGNAAPQARIEEPTGAVNDRLTNLLARDIGWSWKLRDAARELAFSERSLQRHLGACARSFSSVLRRARMREATRLLTETDTTLAEIGYCCGYADQAHFQRDFQRVTNMTPKTFRDLAHETGVILQ